MIGDLTSDQNKQRIEAHGQLLEASFEFGDEVFSPLIPNMIQPLEKGYHVHVHGYPIHFLLKNNLLQVKRTENARDVFN